MYIKAGFILIFLFILTAALAPIEKATTFHDKATRMESIDYIPFIPGEYLNFNLHYGIINAGEASLSIGKDEKKIAGHNHFEVNVSGKSYSFFDPFYKVRDKYQSYIDEKTMYPTVFVRDVQEGNFAKKENYIFVRSKNEVISGSKTFTVDPDMHDLVSTFYYIRCIDFSKQKPGTNFEFATFFDEKVMHTGIRYTGKEIISTKFGKMRCYVFKPILVKGRVFKNQDDMLLYVSEDRNQIPVRIQSKIYLDYVKADLESYKNLKYPLTALVDRRVVSK